MAKKIYQSDFLTSLSSDVRCQNDLKYFILRLVAKGRKKIIMAEPALFYSDEYGRNLNDSVLRFLDEMQVDYVVNVRNHLSIFDSPILIVLSHFYDENNKVISCR